MGRAVAAGLGDPSATRRAGRQVPAALAIDLELVAEPGLEPGDASGLVLVALLTGVRRGELAGLIWPEVDMTGSGAIRLGSRTKTGIERVVTFDVSPVLLPLLSAMHLRGRMAAKSKARVFPGVSVAGTRDPLHAFGAPEAKPWQVMRATCGSYLSCAPAIYGGASAYMSAARLRHGVDVAQRHYLGAVLDIPHDARTLEAAMGVEDLAGEIVALVKGRTSKRKRARQG